MIGESDGLLITYIVSAMAASYLLPIVVAIYYRSVIWLFIIPIVTSVVFVIPSSFVAAGGCEAGKEEAIWAMRTIPILAIAELTFAPDDERMTCATF